MAKIRDPAREKAYLLWKEAGGKKAPKGVLTDIAEKLNKNVSLIRKWKNIDEWEQTITNKNNSNVTDKNGNVTSKKKLIQKAKAIVINGGTLEEAADRTGLNESTLKNYSAKEKWIDQQEKFMQKVYGELQREFGELHIQDKRNAIKYIHNSISEVLMKENQKILDMKEIALKKETMDFILKSLKGQSELIGVTDVKTLVDINLSEQDLEIKKQKIRDPKGKDKTGSFLDKLEEFL